MIACHTAARETFDLVHIRTNHVTRSISLPRNLLLILQLHLQRLGKEGAMDRIASLCKAPTDSSYFGILLLYCHQASKRKLKQILPCHSCKVLSYVHG